MQKKTFFNDFFKLLWQRHNKLQQVFLKINFGLFIILKFITWSSTPSWLAGFDNSTKQNLQERTVS